ALSCEVGDTFSAGEPASGGHTCWLGSLDMTLSLASSPDSSARDDAITIIDLFAGVGGLSEGFHRASDRYRVLKAVEMEPRAAAGYRLNHDTDVYCGPIQEWLRDEEVPSADLVIGGPPC